MSFKLHSVLEIKSFKLPVFIGQTSAERAQAQSIYFHIKIGFQKPPKEELTDRLSKNSVCYQWVCDQIKMITKKKKFLTVERLARSVLDLLKSKLPLNTKVQAAVHKAKPPIKELKGGVFYTCGDGL